MQSTDIEEIKTALWLQACHGCTQVRCPQGQVMAVRKSKGHLQALCRGWGRWLVVEGVTIERPGSVPPGGAILGSISSETFPRRSKGEKNQHAFGYLRRLLTTESFLSGESTRRCQEGPFCTGKQRV